ncbi:hypothetical protein [Nonomuraea fuscirosea]|uniref:hypothetical protein n=1 Tax=Nonomuraea fuscirosea TaxID=1291556 RepID=UPI003F4DC675
MPHPRRWWILGVLCAVLLVISVDNMIRNLAVPSLMRDLGSTPADVQWILDAYILVFAGFLITRGQPVGPFRPPPLPHHGPDHPGHGVGLGDTRRTTLAPGRLPRAHGLGSRVRDALHQVDPHRRLRRERAAQRDGRLVGGGMVGLVAGPVLGGLLLQHFRWSAVFLINVPLAVIGILAAYAIVSESRGPARPSDPLGVALSITAMATLVWATISLPHAGWSASVAAALAVAVLALVAFAVWESRSRHRCRPWRCSATATSAGPASRRRC